MRSTNPERLEKCKAARATEALVWPEISANLLKANAATDESKKAHFVTGLCALFPQAGIRPLLLKQRTEGAIK